jgi:hypothetical protein
VKRKDIPMKSLHIDKLPEDKNQADLMKYAIDRENRFKWMPFIFALLLLIVGLIFGYLAASAPDAQGQVVVGAGKLFNYRGGIAGLAIIGSVFLMWKALADVYIGRGKR